MASHPLRLALKFSLFSSGAPSSEIRSDIPLRGRSAHPFDYRVPFIDLLLLAPTHRIDTLRRGAKGPLSGSQWRQALTRFSMALHSHAHDVASRWPLFCSDEGDPAAICPRCALPRCRRSHGQCCMGLLPQRERLADALIGTGSAIFCRLHSCAHHGTACFS